MKIRTGFVSKSSSSSFTCVMAVEDYKDIISTFMLDEQEFIDKANLEYKKIDTTNMVLIKGTTGAFCEINGYCDEANEQFSDKVIRKLIKTIKDSDYNYFYTEVDI